MSGNLAISVRGLGKDYTIAHNQVQHSTTAEALMNKLKNPFQRSETETFHALQDVSFEVEKGDVVGVIGRNGAGKSTLLKVLSRITEPTFGEIDLYGRVGSLLEVGTGFHAELTGRENIYLNGSILGMTRREITSQFDAIVEFSGVEQFLDTPVKRYSSGMYVRLAFAVAAHLRSEILIVDEVLAVGDAEFQNKCLGKMKDVSRSGRTVLFVSHNMMAVRNLCSSSIILESGTVREVGSTEKCISIYMSSGGSGSSECWKASRKKENALAIVGVSLELSGEQPNHSLGVDVNLTTQSAHKPAFIAFDVLDPTGTSIMQALPTMAPFIQETDVHHLVSTTICLPPLIPGQYFVTVWVGSHNTETLDEEKQCVSFFVTESPTKHRNIPHTADHGMIVPHSVVEYKNLQLANSE